MWNSHDTTRMKDCKTSFIKRAKKRVFVNDEMWGAMIVCTSAWDRISRAFGIRSSPWKTINMSIIQYFWAESVTLKRRYYIGKRALRQDLILDNPMYLKRRQTFTKVLPEVLLAFLHALLQILALFVDGRRLFLNREKKNKPNQDVDKCDNWWMIQQQSSSSSSSAYQEIYAL